MKSFYLLAASACLAACSAQANPPQYSITYNVGNIPDGQMIYLLDYDTSEKVDSAVVTDRKALFKGDVETPFLGRFNTDGARLGTLFVEPGEIAFDGEIASGTPLNAAFADYIANVNEIQQRFARTDNDSLRQSIYNEYLALNSDMVRKNADNPFGYYIFLQGAYELSKDELNEALAQYPALAKYARIQKILDTFARKEATAPGKMFTDFEIEYNGEKYRLSDYVGKGRYTLVDFWASWCGPCRRESKVIKQIYDAHKDGNLDVLGIAVWDEPEATLRAIDELKLPWKQIINGQTIPTDLYGILGIPCIILFGPDGTIITRDLQGEDLVNAVEDALLVSEVQDGVNP